ncbi:MAG: glycosyltransferase family 2 protein [Candidatus Taylorbacteria bacterium]|nr:glycosyltransferase family 2 protein [Candidatus Taylorbacteria bacterium]
MFQQDHPDFEVIIIDNANTDKTLEIAKRFPVRIVSETRRGTMWACERGRQEARGEIIVRMDADCIPGKDWLSQGASFFENEKVVGVSGPYDYHDAKSFFRITSLHFQKTIYKLVNFLLQLVPGRGGVMLGGNSFFRAKSLAAAGGFNTDIYFYGDDTDSAKRVSKHGKVVFNNSLVMKTSARRFHKEGILKLQIKYIIPFLKVIFYGSKRLPKEF